MLSYYLVQDNKGLYYIRERLFGLLWGSFLDNSNPLHTCTWTYEWKRHAYFRTEADALRIWEVFKRGMPKTTFTTLRKLT